MRTFEEKYTCPKCGYKRTKTLCENCSNKDLKIPCKQHYPHFNKKCKECLKINT